MPREHVLRDGATATVRGTGAHISDPCAGELHRQCHGALAKKDVAACEVFAEGASGTARQRAAAWVNLGHQYFWAKDRLAVGKAAMAAWDRAIAIDPDFAEPYIQKAAVQADAQPTDEALAFLDKAAALDPGNWRVARGKAKLLMALKRYPEAVKAARQAVALAPENGAAHQVLAVALEHDNATMAALDEYERAGQGFDEATHQVPGMMQERAPMLDAARLHLRFGHPGAAVKAISRMIDGRPEQMVDPFNLKFRSEAYEVMGRYGDAAADLDRAAVMLSTELAAEFRTKAAVLKVKAGNTETAKTDFHDLLRSGSLKTVLRIQVFLRNNGFEDVEIDGKVSGATEQALEHCLADSQCAAGVGQPI